MEDRPEADPVIARFGGQLPHLGNEQLLASLDLLLLEAERRLLRYARRGPEILEMADEGLVFAVRSSARLRQAQSAAAHCAGHLQVLGVGNWSPRSTNPGWASDPRLTTNEPPDEHDHGG
jgi:hypothetical protein